MDLAAAGLSEQPFRPHGKPLAVVSYGAMRTAVETLKATCKHRHGISLLQGPSLSGKTTLIRNFRESMTADCFVAVIEGKGLDTPQLLISILHQFGYDLELCSTTELVGMVRVFASQQTVSHTAPMLIIEDAHELSPGALRCLCELATLRVHNMSALKMVLVSDRSLAPMVGAQAMTEIAQRVVHDFHLHPMTESETRLFLHTKLRAAGSDCPEFIFQDSRCSDIWQATAGWPGLVDQVARLALVQADTLPVARSAIERPNLPAGTWGVSDVAEDFAFDDGTTPPPRLTVTNNGSMIDDATMDEARLLIGRSEHNEISIGSRFVSRHHALLVRHKNTTFLMDLNSTNGTFVNSLRVTNHVLCHNDVITIGHHQIKFHDPFACSSKDLDGVELDDTAIMKTLQDMRNRVAEDNAVLRPTATENLPTIQT